MDRVKYGHAIPIIYHSKTFLHPSRLCPAAHNATIARDMQEGIPSRLN